MLSRSIDFPPAKQGKVVPDFFKLVLFASIEMIEQLAIVAALEGLIKFAENKVKAIAKIEMRFIENPHRFLLGPRLLLYPFRQHRKKDTT